MKNKILIIGIIIIIVGAIFAFFFIKYQKQACAWNLAKKENTVVAFQKYMDAYKEGKVKVCKDENIDIIIDDDINNYLVFKEHGVNTLLFDDKCKYLDIVDRVGSWEEVLDILLGN